MAKNLRILALLLLLTLTVWAGAQENTNADIDAESSATQKKEVNIQPNIVKVAVGDSAGSGIIWRLTEDEVVIASAKHLLMQDVEAEVTFYNEETATAQVIGLSAQYDIGFLKVTSECEAQLAEALQPLELSLQERTQSGTQVIQAAHGESYEGEVLDYLYIPEFGTEVLRTQCYSRAGMSGGGVFDTEGWLLGMIVGGDSADTGVKEAYITYALPTILIESEYSILCNS